MRNHSSQRCRRPSPRQVDFRERIKEVLNFRIWPSNGDSDALETGGEAGGEAPAVEGAAVPPEHPAAAALRTGGHAELAFGFSAGGLLFPYYIGVIFRLHELGVVTRAFQLLQDTSQTIKPILLHRNSLLVRCPRGVGGLAAPPRYVDGPAVYETY